MTGSELYVIRLLPIGSDAEPSGGGTLPPLLDLREGIGFFQIAPTGLFVRWKANKASAVMLGNISCRSIRGVQMFDRSSRSYGTSREHPEFPFLFSVTFQACHPSLTSNLVEVVFGARTNQERERWAGSLVFFHSLFPSA